MYILSKSMYISERLRVRGVCKASGTILSKLDHFGKVEVKRGTTVTTTWQGQRVDAFIPAPMPRTVDLPERVARATERAAASLLRIDDRLVPRFEPLARLLLRSEGIASSYIEGVRAPAELVAVAEVDSGAVDPTAAWVADNLGVVDASLVHARSGAVLTADHLHRWHIRLMAHGALPDELVGQFRRVQNWIGGATPRQAAYVPPPAEHVERLMRDLLRPWLMPSSRRYTPTATVTAGSAVC